jgi:hypothetical protein
VLYCIVVCVVCCVNGTLYGFFNIIFNIIILKFNKNKAKRKIWRNEKKKLENGNTNEDILSY